MVDAYRRRKARLAGRRGADVLAERIRMASGSVGAARKLGVGPKFE
jgi:hypothetical protein